MVSSKGGEDLPHKPFFSAAIDVEGAATPPGQRERNCDDILKTESIQQLLESFDPRRDQQKGLRELLHPRDDLFKTLNIKPNLNLSLEKGYENKRKNNESFFKLICK
ncbi:hypothetical protein TNCV_408411 [Trichonephila clavipes]|nr:hypothetical protein TNCV_408411 [Trichonephila clavipes]